MPQTAKVKLLGKPSVADPLGNAIPGLGSGKPFAILAYLLIRKSARREELVALLWGEGDESKSRNAFRQSFHRLRTALGPDIFKAERDHIELDLASVWCDVPLFESALSAGRTEEAISLYLGPFLDGFSTGEAPFDNWAFDQQSRLQTRYLGALQQWTQEALTQGQWETAVQRAETLLQTAPLDVDAALLGANALVASGRRSEALAILKSFATRFNRDLEQPPPPVVRDMMLRLDGSSVKGTFTTTTPAPQADERMEEGAQREPNAVSSSYHPSHLGSLLKSWKSVIAGKGATVLVQGGPDTGKAQLISDFLTQVSALDSVLVLRGIERTGSYTIPYASIAEALRGAIGAPGVAGASQHLLAEAARLLPELKDQFNLPEPGSVADDASRVRFFEGIAALIDAAAYEQPVCLILEDLHNASDGTVELVHYLSTRLKDSQVLILVSYRGSGSAIAQRYADMQRSGSLERIDLGGDNVPLAPDTPTKPERWRKYIATRPVMAASVLVVVLSVAVIAASLQHSRGIGGRANRLTDTLVIAEHRGPNEKPLLYGLSGDIGEDLEELIPDSTSVPAWTKSLQLPWINPVLSPNKRYVALERMTSTGTDIYVISSDRRDTISLATDSGDDIVSGWSPDGSSLLVIHSDRRPAAEANTHLYAYPVNRNLPRTIIDGSSERSVTHAAWSPTGTHIAWSARSDSDKQQDIYIAHPDGSNLLNLTNHPSEDYNFVWSPDGNWITFTSERDGSADLYTVEHLTGRLRRLTWDTGQDDHASFSPDGRFVAYESVHDGERAIYITPFWGGTPKRVSRPSRDGGKLSIVGWYGPAPRYVDKISITVPKEFSAAASASATAYDQAGDTISFYDVDWMVLDNATARFQAAPLPRTSELLEDYIPSGRIIGIKPGPARLVAAARGWRAETTFVVVK